MKPHMGSWLLGLGLAGCLANHRSGAVEVERTDCVACHRQDYEQAAYPHVTRMPTTCARCHVEQQWATTRHPESAFPLAQGAHRQVACLACHQDTRGPDAGGANVACSNGSCHPEAWATQAHAGVASFRYEPSQPTFCRGCHPTGVRE